MTAAFGEKVHTRLLFSAFQRRLTTTEKSFHSRFQLEQVTPNIYLNNCLVDILGHTK